MNLSNKCMQGKKNVGDETPIGFTNHHERREEWHEMREGEHHGEGQIQLRLVKLDFPKFSGDDPMTWVYKANKLFQQHNTSP